MFGWPDEECKPDLYLLILTKLQRSDEWAEVDKAQTVTKEVCANQNKPS